MRGIYSNASAPMLLDIRPDYLQIVLNILQKHVPQYEVWAFGSRAKWTAKEYSDLDLCIVSDKPLSFSVLGAMEDDFSDSDLPWKVDVVDWATTSASFRKVIEKDKVVVQRAGSNSLTRLRFGDCAILTKDSIHPSDVPNAKYVGLEHIGQGTLSFNGFGYAREVDSQKLRFKTGDILFGKLRPYFRKLVVAPFDGVCSTDIWVVRPKQGTDRNFLFYWMALPEFVDGATQASEGTRMPRAKWEYVSNFEIADFSFSEQVDIGATLRALDNKITLLRETNATLEAIAQALFKSWFVNFDPVRAKAEGREPEGIPPEIAALFPSEFEDSELGEIPKGWRAGTLAKLATLNPESWTAKKHPATVAYIDLANAKDNEIAAVTDYPFDKAPSRARRVLRNGDTIVGTVRPGNRSFAFIHEPAENLTASTGFALLRPIEIQNTEFVYLAATQNSSIEYLAHVADGGAYPAVRPEVVTGLTCILPSKEVMQVFHEATASLLASIAEKQKQAETLATFRDTLLPQLMSGKLRVKADESIPEVLTA